MAGASRIRLRPATTGDAPFIERVHKAAIRGVSRRFYSPAELESWAAGLQPEFYCRAMDGNGERFLLAETPTRGVVGFCAFARDEVYGLYVDPPFAGRGVGGLLLAEAEIAAAGETRIRIGASLAALAFYRRRGYRIVQWRIWRSRGGLELKTADLERAVARRRAGERPRD